MPLLEAKHNIENAQNKSWCIVNWYHIFGNEIAMFFEL